uniref:Reverse transcriptase zinc-binding domain-containing protein n=1 Tax=Oryza brachyantha TaxID=4533 RepID=J3M5K6_ORYBR
MLNEQASANNIKGVALSSSGPSIISLFYADDLIITGQANLQEATNLITTLSSFLQISGQTPNWGKSSILFSSATSQEERNIVKGIFPVSDFSAATTYLGHPIFLAASTRSAAYFFLVDKFRGISSLRANKLSHAGRLTLIKSVFSSIPIYYMSHMLLSAKLIRKLTSIIRKFWWKGSLDNNSSDGICFRSWKDICRPKDEGGLGIRDLMMMNKSLVIHSAWNFLKNPNTLIAQVLKHKYFPHTSFWNCNKHTPKSAFWSSVLKLKPILHSSCIWQLSQGDISIWNQPCCDIWEKIHEHNNTTALSLHLPSKVSELWTNQKSWNTPLISTYFHHQAVHSICQVQVIPHLIPDNLCWKHTSTGDCSTSSAYKEINRHSLLIPVTPEIRSLMNLIWKNKLIPPKIKVFTWRLLSKALPSGVNLNTRIPAISAHCSRCGQLENEGHIFFHCYFARLTWLISPFHLNTSRLPPDANPEHYICCLLSTYNAKFTIQRVLILLWQIWKARNDKLFRAKH